MTYSTSLIIFSSSLDVGDSKSHSFSSIMSSILFFFSANSSSRASMTTDSMKSPSASSSLASGVGASAASVFFFFFPSTRSFAACADTASRVSFFFTERLFSISGIVDSCSASSPSRSPPSSLLLAAPSPLLARITASRPRLAPRARDKRSQSTSTTRSPRAAARIARIARPLARDVVKRSGCGIANVARIAVAMVAALVARARTSRRRTMRATSKPPDDAPSRSDAVGAIPRGRHRTDDNLIQRSTETDTCCIYK